MGNTIATSFNVQSKNSLPKFLHSWCVFYHTQSYWTTESLLWEWCKTLWQVDLCSTAINHVSWKHYCAVLHAVDSILHHSEAKQSLLYLFCYKADSLWRKWKGGMENRAENMKQRGIKIRIQLITPLGSVEIQTIPDISNISRKFPNVSQRSVIGVHRCLYFYVQQTVCYHYILKYLSKEGWKNLLMLYLKAEAGMLKHSVSLNRVTI